MVRHLANLMMLTEDHHAPSNTAGMLFEGRKLFKHQICLVACYTCFRFVSPVLYWRVVAACCLTCLTHNHAMTNQLMQVP